MKNNLLFFLTFILMAACGDQASTPPDLNGRVFNRDNLQDCIKKELYLDSDVDLETYEGISTDYFTEIKDYTGQEEVALYEALMARHQMLDQEFTSSEIDLDSNQLERKKQLVWEMDSIRNSLRAYDKEVVGYVFLHTFKTLQDTQAVLFLMDTRCIRTEAIPVKYPLEGIDPEQYRRRLIELDTLS